MNGVDLKALADQFATDNGISINRVVGEGSYKISFSATLPDGRAAALKVSKTIGLSDRQRQELEISLQLKGNSVAELWDVQLIQSPGGPIVITVEEFIPGGTLTDWLNANTFDATCARTMIQGLSSALLQFESLRLVHRDIKPDNIMLRSDIGSPVLIDYGIVRDLSKTSITAPWAIGPMTPIFAAPEQLTNSRHLFGPRTDQFCLGVTCATSLLGYHPAKSSALDTRNPLDLCVSGTTCSPESSKLIRDSGCDFLLTMLAPFPIYRYSSVQKLLDAL